MFEIDEYQDYYNEKYGKTCYKADLYPFLIDELRQFLDQFGCGECTTRCEEYKPLDDVGWDINKNYKRLLKELEVYR